MLWIDWHGGGNTPQVTAEAIRNPMGEGILRKARSTAEHLYRETCEWLEKNSEV